MWRQCRALGRVVVELGRRRAAPSGSASVSTLLAGLAGLSGSACLALGRSLLEMRADGDLAEQQCGFHLGAAPHGQGSCGQAKMPTRLTRAPQT